MTAADHFGAVQDPPAASAAALAAVRPLKRYRSIWISDVHLGTRDCKAELLLEFLMHSESDDLYLVGDLIDFSRLKALWYWPPMHTRVIEEVLDRARRGTRVTYLPGNHDRAVRDLVGCELAGVTVASDAVHHTMDGRRFLVMHGDQFDVLVRYTAWFGGAANKAYRYFLALHARVSTKLDHFLGHNRLDSRADVPRVVQTGGVPLAAAGFLVPGDRHSTPAASVFGRLKSVSMALRRRLKRRLFFVGRYETAVAREAGLRAVDGVVCGHVHHAQMRKVGPIAYCNSGDWVKSCTALVEQRSGELEIVNWPDARATEIGEPAVDPVGCAVVVGI